MRLSTWCFFIAVLTSTSTLALSKEQPKPVAPAETPANVFESNASVTAHTEIDRLVLAKLKAAGVQPRLCSDSVFVRRAYLDVIGTLPTAEEARRFLDDPDPQNKRRALIEELMQRDEFATYWAMKWGDTLRIKAEFPINLWPNAAQAYHRWVHASIVENKPYDQFARELLTSSGSNFRVPPVNFYRAIQSKTPEGITAAVAITLMGARTDHWSETQRQGMSVFFSQVGYKPTAEWKEEIVFWDPLSVSDQFENVAPGSPVPGAIAKPADEENDDNSEQSAASQKTVPAMSSAMFPDGTKVTLPPNQDPREVFADWLIQADNPWFAKCAVNRVWAWIMGRGIIDPADDIREDNLPSHPELLAYLEKEFVDSGYDLKHLYHLILTSQVFQFSSLPIDKSEVDFATYPLRRLDAEVLIDAINSITGTTELYTSPIPEPFTYIPRGEPAIAIADGSITSPFLTLFGRSARATGMANERNNNPVPSQWLHTLNSSHIQKKLVGSEKLKKLYTKRQKIEQTLEELYLTVLSRRPLPGEVETAMAYATNDKLRRYAWIDVTWALINNTEFLYRH